MSERAKIEPIAHFDVQGMQHKIEELNKAMKAGLQVFSSFDVKAQEQLIQSAYSSLRSAYQEVEALEQQHGKSCLHRFEINQVETIHSINERLPSEIQ
ncbi:hypothetical protein HDV01_005474 [Terramyces sp. JEL0728]|nr:hypothetical protein HDV01_005474 [Terramyces sp. JEL0728]